MSEPSIPYDNIFASGVTATDTEATGDYSVDYIYDLRPFTRWKADTFGTKYITMDAGAAVPVDSLSIVGHNFGDAAATVSLESSTTGAWGGEEVEQIAGFVPSDNKIIYKQFAQATVRYWRVKIVTVAIAPEIGVLLAGERMDFPIYPDAPFTPKRERINATAPVSKAGHFLGVTSYYTPTEHRAKFSWVPVSFLDGDYTTFWEDHARGLSPFIWIPNLTAWPTKFYFVRMRPSADFGPPLADTENADSFDLMMEGRAE